MKAWGYICVLLLLAGAFFAGRATRPCRSGAVVRSDTVTVIDTVVREIPVPRRVEIVRIDTCYLAAVGAKTDTGTAATDAPAALIKAAADTVRVPVAVPIERKEYASEEYRAVVEGYRAALVEMEVYPRRQVVTVRETTPAAGRPSRWSLALQAGYGIGPSGPAPYIGLGVSFSLVRF